MMMMIEVKKIDVEVSAPRVWESGHVIEGECILESPVRLVAMRATFGKLGEVWP